MPLMGGEVTEVRNQLINHKHSESSELKTYLMNAFQSHNLVFV